MKVLLCTRDLTYGAGNHIKQLLEVLEESDRIEEVLVIAPESLAGFSERIRFERFYLPGRYFIEKQPLYSFICNQKISKNLRIHDIDLIHLHFPIMLREYDIPIVSTFHTMNYSQYRANLGGTLKVRLGAVFHRFYEVYDVSTLRRSSKALFVSRRTHTEAIRRYGNDIDALFFPNTVNTDFFMPLRNNEVDIIRQELGIPLESKVVLFVGRMDLGKGVMTAIDAVAKARESDSGIILVILGGGPLENSLPKRDYIDFRGKVTQKTVSDFYKASDLFILPSIYENFPLSLLEAMSSGLPVLAYDTGDIAEIVADDYSLLTTLDPIEWGRRIIDLLSLPGDIRKRVGSINRNRVLNNYSRDHLRNIIDVYSELAE